MISHTKKCDEGIMRRLEVSESRWLLRTGTKERSAVSLPSRTLEKSSKEFRQAPLSRLKI